MNKLLIKQKIKLLVFIFIIPIITNYPKTYALDNIKIINLKSAKYTKDHNHDGTGFDKQCKNWHLNKQQIKKIFHLSEETTYIGLTEYTDFSCEINGKLKFKGKIINFSVNAGSFISVWDKGYDTVYYACAKKECTKFFP